jgi:succinate dehydrogenase / fumarate reductase cytochrome b subunit
MLTSADGQTRLAFQLAEHDDRHTYVGIDGKIFNIQMAQIVKRDRMPISIMPEGLVLWLFRFGLIVMLTLHVVSAAQLTAMNRRARPTRYQSSRDYIAANFASRSMRWTGLIMFLFIAFHLANLTFGWLVPGFVRADVYGNVVANFEQWPVSIIYIAANIAVAIHLFHGTWSVFQSLGLNNPRFNGVRRGFAAGVAVTVAVVNCSFPIMVLAGVVN